MSPSRAAAMAWPVRAPFTSRFLLRAVLVIVAALAALLVALLHPGSAWALEAAEAPSVLVVDAGLGDYEAAGLRWLGEGIDLVAEHDGFALTTANDPAWWLDETGASEDARNSAAGVAPATFLLGSASGRSLTGDAIVWALDQIRETGAEPRTFVIGMGASGIPLREYVEDLANTKQSKRADIVGLAFCGTPQNGYSTIEVYPEQDLWGTVAQAAGLSLEDVGTQSARLKTLNAGAFPRMVKTLSVSGAAGDLGFGLTDGAGVAADFALAESVTDQVVLSQVAATISRQANLTGFWEPFTSSINYSGRSVDAQLSQRLSAIDSYETSDDVRAVVRDFYRTWFSNGVPVTHNSNVLLLDLSGSMTEAVEGAGSKLSAAKEAAGQYLQAMQECSELPQSAPMDVTVFGFNESITKVTEGYDQASIDALGGMSAHSETNIGIALDQALETLATSPTCADKHILLLSDGESTRGKSDEGILSSAVAQAAASGIVVDAIGFGDTGESDAAFLQRVVDATGGTYYQASDTYSLKVDFLKSYYSSLGLEIADKEATESDSVVQVGSLDAQTSALQVGVVSTGADPGVRLLRDGAPVDDASYTVRQQNGLTSIRCLNPVSGAYAIELSGLSGAAHVFAVQQPGVARAADVEGEQTDYSLPMLIGAGALLVAALVVVMVRGSRKPKVAAASGAAERLDPKAGRGGA